MGNFTRNIQRVINKMSKREKILTAISLLSLLFYFSYLFLHHSTFNRTISAGLQVLALKTELKKKDEIHKKYLSLGHELKDLKTELNKKEAAMRELEKKMRARDQISRMLGTLEVLAKSLSLRMEKISIKTEMVSKSWDYEENKTVKTGTGKSEKSDGRKTGVVKAEYVHNRVSLSCRSSYHAILKYLEKVKELPYALSILTIDMYKRNVKTKGESTQQMAKRISSRILNTDIEMDIYLK